MQQDREVIVGLDIGTTKISVIAGCLDALGNLEVLGVGNAPSEGVIRGMVTNIDKTVQGIQQAIAQAEEQSNLHIGVVNVGIAGQQIRSYQQRGSITRESGDTEISRDDIARLTNDMYRLVTPPGTEILHVFPQDFTVDYEGGIKDPVGMSGVKLEADFHIITAPTNAISNIHKCLKRARLDVQQLMLEPIASSLSVLSDEEREAGVALVDIGGGTTDLAIYYEGLLRHTSVIPFGGAVITKDIKEGCAIMPNQAEALKVRFGKALSEIASDHEVVSIPGLKNRAPKEISVKNLACIIEARMEEIVEMLYGEIVRSGYDNRLAGGIVLTGGGAQLPHLKELFELVTGLDVRIGNPTEYLGKTRTEAVKNPMYATALGLVLAGLKAGVPTRVPSEVYERPVAPVAKPVAISQPQSSRVEPKGNGNIFQKGLDKIKGFLVDDFGPDKDY